MKIIKLLDPIEVLGNSISVFVNRVGDLNIHNNDQDIIMWVSKKNTHLIKDIRAGIIICPK
ncbi:MAG: hypothetical protein IPN89_14730 [Saprospiraceae bacterium]|nr:hypothetical protein [Saprospiraceae bacterium]